MHLQDRYREEERKMGERFVYNTRNRTDANNKMRIQKMKPSRVLYRQRRSHRPQPIFSALCLFLALLALSGNLES